MTEQDVPSTPKILSEPPLVPHPQLGPYRKDDYMALPDEPRCELIRGRIYLCESRTALHQLAVQRLDLAFSSQAFAAGGFPLSLPLDVVLADHSVVQPDILYISKSRLEIVERQVEGAPDLLVEVVSPATERCDRGEKLMLYAQSGVPEYWILDPDSLTIECLVNEGGRFIVSPPADGRVQSPRLPEVGFDLAAFWIDFLSTLRRVPRVRRSGQGYEAPTRQEFEELRGRLRYLADDVDQFLAAERPPEASPVAPEPQT